MAIPAKLNLTIHQGTTFSEVLRWEGSTKVYKIITNVTNAAPAVLTSVAHGIPEGWRVKVTNVVGMTQINSSDTYRKATVLTSDTIELNEINAAGYSTYTSGGILEYNQPTDLSGYTARMQIRARVDSTDTLKDLTTENGGILINNTDKTITINISATDTAAFTWTTGVYSLELVTGSTVSTLLVGNVYLRKEVTR